MAVWLRYQNGECTGPSLKEWFLKSAASMPTLLCMDSNSAPGQQVRLLVGEFSIGPGEFPIGPGEFLLGPGEFPIGP
eukprot:1159833-Prorocentrum_minimum.AAC.3